MKRRKGRPESKLEKYGYREVLDMHTREAIPERELWSAVILHAMSNINFKVKHWQDDVEFLAGGGSFPDICCILGMDERRASQGALKAAFSGKNFMRKH